ncbi:hypothetical protein HG66A1_34880 [Gimesia chilikensis]|uniref:Uncharacterized protein n=1 Tax=Gimesia chilikensis TaxID=2605989 RepID=A0A517PQM4_9PLAN|nr:hypothetical protein HG66A1_34880 [Gimesia chilikensis]
MAYTFLLRHQMDHSLKQRLKILVVSDTSLQFVIEELRQVKSEGFQQEKVRTTLEGLRQECKTEKEEDRILELLDFVTGFCAPDNRIWEN